MNELTQDGVGGSEQNSFQEKSQGGTLTPRQNPVKALKKENDAAAVGYTAEAGSPEAQNGKIRKRVFINRNTSSYAPREGAQRKFTPQGERGTDKRDTRPRSYNTVYSSDNTEQTQQKFPRGNSGNLQVMFFGGVGEIGKNMTAFKFRDEILVVDCGVAFPSEEMPGVDLVIPDMSYLKQNADKVKGIVITHAHEDHIGSMPYFLDTVKAPVYASRLTLALIENKLREFPKVKMKGNAVNPRNVVRIGCFTVEFINVNHSVAGAYALSITTPVGIVFVSGDFKIDFTPIAGETTDLSRMGELGQKGVLLLMCESTNIERDGYSMSERVVGETLDRIFETNKENRLIITAFASNVHRIQQIMDLARKYGRKVAFAGRSMINNMEVSMKIGEIKYDRNLIIDIDRAHNYADKELLILATGSQGQSTTALSRMAAGAFPNIVIGNTDTVIFSSSPVPGNEKPVNNIINELVHRGAKVFYDDLADVHASGHAYKHEIMLVHKLLKPKFFIPMHGEYKHLKYHKELAVQMGMRDTNVIVPELGMLVEVGRNSIKTIGSVPAGELLIDGLGVGDTNSIVLKDRKQLAEDGLCIVVLGISASTGEVVSGPDLIPRGFIYSHEVTNLIEDAKTAVVNALNETQATKQDWNTVKTVVRRTLTNLFYKKTKRKPVIIPIVLELN